MSRPRKNKNKYFTSNPQNNQISQEDIQSLTQEELRLFSQAVGNNITKNPLWMNEILKQQSTSSYKYKKSDVLKLIENPSSNEKQLREVAMYLYNTKSIF